MFFLFAIKQNPTPQLKVLSISESLILFFFSHLNIFEVLIFDKFILRHRLLGTTLIKLFTSPPPVMLAHPFINFFFLSLFISFT